MSGTVCVVKTRITNKGIEYASCEIHQRLIDHLRKLDIGDHSGKDHGANWEIRSVENKECAIERCNIAFSPADDGLSWLLDNVSISLRGNWKAKYRKKFIEIKDHGEISVKVKGLRFQVHIKLGVDENGRPTMCMAKCDIHIHDVDVKFHGGAAFIYNVFRDFCGQKLKTVIRDKLHSLLERFINQDGPTQLSKLRLSAKIDENFTLDYGLLESPKMKADCLDTELKGKVRWQSETSQVPFMPKAMPAFEDQTKMLYLELSEHIINSMGFLGHENNYFQYNKTFEKLTLELKITTLSAPQLSITKEKIQVNISTNVSGCLGQLPLPTVNVDISLDIQPLIVEEKVKGKLLDQKLKLDQLESFMAAVPDVKNKLNAFVTDQVSKILEKGVDLPVTGAVKFVNPSLELVEGAILIGTDVQVI